MGTVVKTDMPRVAGRIEPRRRTIFGRAYESYCRRTDAAWRAGIRYYLSLLRPLWRALLIFGRREWRTVVWLASIIATAIANWRGRTSKIFSWVRKGSRGILNWMSGLWEDLKTIVQARKWRQPLTTDSLQEMTKARSCLLSFFIRIIAVGIAIWAIRNYFQSVAAYVGVFFSVILSAVFFVLMVSDLSTLFQFIFILLGVPVIMLLGFMGFLLLAVISLLYVAILLCILVVITAVSLGGTALLFAGTVGVAAASLVLFIPIAIGSIGFGLYLLGLVLFQSLVLSAITITRPGQYVWVIWRGIAYVCPSGRCSNLQVPAHACPDCGSAYSRLWPSFYGVIHHRCEGVKDNHPCHHFLPTLNSLGRNQLNRFCVSCGGQFVSRSSGKLPVSVVGIAGGTGVGKTTMMLMATAELIAHSKDKQTAMIAEIDTGDQRIAFDREMRRLATGVRVAPTSGSVPDAFILRVEDQKNRFLLYLYDAPGEEFSHIDTFSQHQWLQRADGLMLLVDPASLPGFIVKAGGPPDPEVQASKTPLNDVVNSCIAAAEKMMDRRSSEGLSVPLAVVVTKADLEAVKRRVGDFSIGISDGSACRSALWEWGAGGAMETIEKRFSNVRYFACSAQGRIFSEKNTSPFSSYGVLNPLLWILKESDLPKAANRRKVMREGT